MFLNSKFDLQIKKKRIHFTLSLKKKQKKDKKILVTSTRLKGWMK